MGRAAKDPETGVTAQQERFAAELVKTGRPMVAYRRAYDASKMSPEAISANANDLINTTAIALRIQHYRQIAVRRLEVTVERIAEELARIGFFDPRELFDDDGHPIPISELPEDAARVIAGIDVEDLFERDEEGRRTKVGQVLKYKLASKQPALETLAKWRKMLIERSESGKPGAFDHMTDEEVEAEARQALEEGVKAGFVKVLPTSLTKAKDKPAPVKAKARGR